MDAPPDNGLEPHSSASSISVAKSSNCAIVVFESSPWAFFSWYHRRFALQAALSSYSQHLHPVTHFEE